MNFKLNIVLLLHQRNQINCKRKILDINLTLLIAKNCQVFRDENAKMYGYKKIRTSSCTHSEHQVRVKCTSVDLTYKQYKKKICVRSPCCISSYLFYPSLIHLLIYLFIFSFIICWQVV